jgi:hypothetical protein
MFSTWKIEKATTALIDEAQALSDRLETAKPHVRDSYAATAQFWAALYLAEAVVLVDLQAWPPAAITRFVKTTAAKVAALRKARDYARSDGLAVWLHTARAVAEPRIAPAVRDIWRQLAGAGPNAAAMTEDMLQEAGLPPGHSSRIPQGFAPEE